MIKWLKQITKRALGINTPGLLDYYLFGGGQATAAGMHINERNALIISAVYECVRVIADTIASLPVFVYKRIAPQKVTEAETLALAKYLAKQNHRSIREMVYLIEDRSGGGKERAVDHSLYTVLHDEPNPLMTPFEFKQCLQGNLCLWGNAFVEVDRNGAGKVIALWPLRPDRMRLQFFNNKLFYYYTRPNGSEEQLRDVLHLRGLSSDGLIGYSPIALQREKLGLAKAADEYRARFFANDARPGGVLTHPGTLSDAAHERLKKSWYAEHGGLANRNRVAILEENMKWQDSGIPPDDAQFVQGQEYEKADIAGIFRVPGYKIGLLKPGTISYASVEQQAIDFVVDCIRPPIVCWEERLTLSLLTPAERKTFFVEFLIDALLRGDSAQRGAFYTAMFNIGVFSQNQILEKENMNGIGALGDRRYVPLNMCPVDLIDEVVLKKNEAPGDTPAEPAKPAGLNGAAH